MALFSNGNFNGNSGSNSNKFQYLSCKRPYDNFFDYANYLKRNCGSRHERFFIRVELEHAGRCEVIKVDVEKVNKEEMSKSGEARRSVTDGIRNGPPQIVH